MEPRSRGTKQTGKKTVNRENKTDFKPEQASHKSIRQFLKWAYRILLFIAVSLSIWSVYTVINRYQISLDWSKNDNSKLTMANQTPDSLYDSNVKSKEAKQKFNEIYADSYNIKTEELTAKATSSEMKKLDDTLSNISKNSRADYQTKYDNLLKKVKVNSLYQDIFVKDDEQTVKVNVTPETIQKLNNEQFGYINQLLINSSNKDQFANRIYTLQKNLAKDAIAINGVMAIAMKTATYDSLSGNVEILKKSTSQQIDDYTNAVSKLHYSWNNLAFLNQIEEVIAKDLATQTEQYQVFDDYKKDLSDKKQADKKLVSLEETLSHALKKQAEDKKQAEIYIKVPRFGSQSEAQKWADKNHIGIAFEQRWSGKNTILSEPSEGNLLKRTAKLKVIIQHQSYKGTSANKIYSGTSKKPSSASSQEAKASSVEESSSTDETSSSLEADASSDAAVSSSESSAISSSTSQVSSSSATKIQ